MQLIVHLACLAEKVGLNDVEHDDINGSTNDVGVATSWTETSSFYGDGKDVA